MFRNRILAAIAVAVLTLTGGVMGSNSASAQGCGPWNNWCMPRCGEWNKLVRRRVRAVERLVQGAMRRLEQLVPRDLRTVERLLFGRCL